MHSPTIQAVKSSKIVIFFLILVFLISGLIVNAVQFTLYVLLNTTSPTLYRRINWYLHATIDLRKDLVFLGDWWSGTKLYMYIDKQDMDTYVGKCHVFSVARHVELDWLMVAMMADRLGLQGDIRLYMKKQVKYIPVIGWNYALSDSILLDRSAKTDEAAITDTIRKLCDYPHPVWVILLPEGTRYTPEKHKASVEYAQRNNLPILKHLLLPRTTGFDISLSAIDERFAVFWNMLFTFDGPVKPTLGNLLGGRPVTAHGYIKRIPMEHVPKTKGGREKFLMDLYVEKDAMVDSFKTTGDLFKTSGVEPLERVEIKRRINSLINTTVWSIVVLLPIFYYSIKICITGQLHSRTAITAILGITAFTVFFYIVARRVMGSRSF